MLCSNILHYSLQFLQIFLAGMLDYESWRLRHWKLKNNESFNL